MIVYRIAPQWQVGLETLEDALQKATFAACGATQERAVGFVPPRGEAHGPLAESVGGQWILRFMVEAKVLPGSVLARKVQDKVDQIERTFLSADDWNVGSALSLVMMVLILLSLGLLRKVDPEGEGGSLI